ncbi:unnamed protein product [Rotaria sp. Silwood1]|nr:unnamed protein product [Rotaria sp. Silwood1]
MSNLPIQSAVNHNDDNDEQTNSTNHKLSTINSRITTPSILKRQQNTETEIANNQAYDEIHDLQPKHSLSKKINNDNSHMKNSTRQYQSHELMQGNYYDPTRFDIDYSSSSNHQSEPILININVEDYKKTFASVCTSKNSNNKNQARSPPFGDTSESIQQGIAQSAGILLELNKKQDNHHHHHHQLQHKITMKNNKSHEQAVINYFPNDDVDDDNNKQRSSSSSSSNDSSNYDSSTSNKCEDDNTKTNIPYEKLLNDEDNDDELIEQTKKPLTESTILLNKNHTQTYGTQQSTTNIPYERSKYLPNNGYNSHGSSITTKSSSDNSGSIRTNSGTDNDEESDEEHYNNSTLSNNSLSMTSSRTKDTSIKSLNKTNDIQYSYLNEQNNFQLNRSNTTRVEQTSNNEPHLQVPRMKQLHIDDLNGNVNKSNPSATDHNTILLPSKSSLQQLSNSQTNILSSSHQNRNIIERNEQQHYSNSSRNNTTRPHQSRGTKKRKQSQQQEIIRTELIPGHRGDRDVDELVMFIDGDSSKQRQNSTPLRPTDTNKPRLSSKINSINDTNSNKTSSRKKSRKSINSLQEIISTTNDNNNNNNDNTNNENQTSNYVTTTEQNIQSVNFIDEDNQTKTHTIIDITNQSLINKNISTDNHDESHLNTVDINSTKTINDESSIPNLFEETRNISLKTDDIDSYSLSSTITNNLNSEIISEPFVTVKNRRRLIKERRQVNNFLTHTTHFLPPSTSSKTHDKRRISSTNKNSIIRPIVRNNLSNTKLNSSSITKEETNNRISSKPIRSAPPPTSDEPLPSSSIVNSTNEQTIEKQQISPRLSSHSSSSSLSSLLKRQTKPPPVIFLNKSIDIELNDVSFGFELDSTTLTKSSDDTNINNQPSTTTVTTTEPEIDISYTSTSPSMQPIQFNDVLNDSSTQKSSRKFSQRNNRSPQFYSGSDIRPHQQRSYPSQSPYIDPLLLLQYNQSRFANYSQYLAYMNLLRTHYVPPQSQYVFLPTTYTTAATTIPTTTNESDHDETTNSTTSEQIQEPLFVYTTPTGQYYFHPSTTKKSSIDTEQQSNSIPTVYTPTIYPSHYFYPSHTQHIIPSPTPYFQPISSSLVDIKSEQNNIDTDDDDYNNSSILYHQIRQQSSSSDIMSNALQLVYSQQRRNAQTDRFNLDDLTAYLAMKWTDTVDHYEQGMKLTKNK